MTIPAGTTWFTVGPATVTSIFYASTNPARFTPIYPAGKAPALPVVYAADCPEGAVAETILRNATANSRIPRDSYRGRALRTLTLNRDLTVAWLHTGGLIATGVHAYQLTDTPPGPANYAQTRLWGQAAYDDPAELDGVVWVSRLWNTSQALLLFSDRTDNPRALTTNLDPVRDFDTSADIKWLREHGTTFGVTFL